jgi:hypothetical protein
MFKSVMLSVVMVVGFAGLACAQATSQSKLGWDQDAPDLVSANSYTYKHYDDSGTTGTVLTPTTCVGTTTPFQCQAPFPAFTPGASHNIVATATNAAGESLKSTPFTFTFIVIPNPPKNLRIIP